MNSFDYRRVLLFLLVGLLCVSVAAPAQEGTREGGPEEKNEERAEAQRIVLYPLEVTAEGATGETLRALSRSFRETLTLTLQMVGDYRAERPERAGPTSGEGLQEYAGELDADAVIFGELRREGRGVGATLRIYDRATDTVALLLEREVESLLDSFGMAETMAVEVVERFSGVRVAFGTLLLEPRGNTDDPYRLRVDGVEAGENLRRMENLLVGSHRVEVFQDRGGEQRVLLDRRVEIEEEAATRLQFELPYLTAEESEYFRSRDRTIVDGWPLEDRQQITSSFSRALERASEGEQAGVEGLAELHTKYLSWRRAFQYYLEGGGEDEQPHLPKRLRPDAAFPYTELPSALLPAALRQSLGRREVRSAAEGAAAFASVDELYRWADEHRIPERRILVDGEFGDWEGVPALEDPALDTGRYGADIGSVQGARRHATLYLAFRLSYGSPEPGMQYRIRLRGRYGELELSIRWRESEERWRTVALTQGAQGQRRLEGLRLARGKEGFELAIPREELSRVIAAGRIGVTAAAGRYGGEPLDTAGPVRAYLPASGSRSAVLAPGGRRGERWRGSLRLGFFSDIYTAPSFCAAGGLYYRLGGAYYLGADLYAMPLPDFNGPPAFGAPALVLREERTQPAHMFNLLPLPGAVAGESGAFFLVGGYGISYRGATAHVLVVTETGGSFGGWVGVFVTMGMLF